MTLSLRSLAAFALHVAAAVVIRAAEYVGRAQELDEPYMPTDADDDAPVRDAVARVLFGDQLADDALIAEYVEAWS